MRCLLSSLLLRFRVNMMWFNIREGSHLPLASNDGRSCCIFPALVMSHVDSTFWRLQTQKESYMLFHESDIALKFPFDEYWWLHFAWFCSEWRVFSFADSNSLGLHTDAVQALVCFIRCSCRRALDSRFWQAVLLSQKFWTLQKVAIQQAHPLHAVIGQVLLGVEVGSFILSLKLSFCVCKYHPVLHY